MADKLGLGNSVRQLKLGQSFTNPKAAAFHTIRYDFKPASVDVSKIASVEVGSNNQVTVTVPHLDGAGVPQTIFKGSQRPYQKECVLVIDRVTGEITLEKLASNLQVKKTRSESVKPPPVAQGAEKEQRSSSMLSAPRPPTPPVGTRTSNKTRVTSGSRRPDRQITHLVPKHSPLHASPNYPSPKRDHFVNTELHNSQSTLASLPMIGLDDPTLGLAPPAPPAQKTPDKSPTFRITEPEVEEMSDSSSSSSDSDSDSDQRNGRGVAAAVPVHKQSPAKLNGYTNGVHHLAGSDKLSTLKQDLCLSEESGSDSD